MEDKVIFALGQCLNLKNFTILNCSFPPSDLSSILQNLTHLKKLTLEQIPLHRRFIGTVCRHCLDLKYLHLASVSGIRDEDLRLLVESCPSLRSLRLLSLENISEKSVSMLINYRPQIASIGISRCGKVSGESVLSLLKEITIPTIFNSEEDEELRISALENLDSSIQYVYLLEGPRICEFFCRESLLERLVELLALGNQQQSELIAFFYSLVQKGYHRLVVKAGVIPILVHHCNSLHEKDFCRTISLLIALHCHSNHHQYLLASGVLSFFRPHRHLLLKVSSSYFVTSGSVFSLVAYLVSGMSLRRRISRFPFSAHLSIVGSDRRLDQHSFFSHRQMC
jgi:hypothetical protein